MPRSLLVVGAGLMQTPAYRHSRDLGIPTIAMDRDPEAPGRGLADSWIEADIADEEACLGQAAKQRSEIGGVLTVGTDFSTTVARIATELGLPGHGYEATLRAKDKAKMRQSLSAAGVPSPKFTVFQGIPPAAFDFSAYLPGVVKPADNMGARGVEKVLHPSEVPAAVARALEHSRMKKVLLEAFIPGDEYSLDSFLLSDRFVPRGLADRDIRFPPRFIEMGHAFPSGVSERIQRELWDCLEAGARALGLDHGAAKGDLKWNNGPVVGEIAARLSGGFMSGWTYPLASGLEPVREAILLAMGLSTPREVGGVLQGVAEGAVLGIPGRILCWEGLDDLPSVPGFRHVFLHRQAGDPTVFPRNNVEKAAQIICVGSSRQEAEKALRRSRRLLVPRLDPTCPDTAEWVRSTFAVSAFGSGDEDWYGVGFWERLADWERLSARKVSALSTGERTELHDWLRVGGLPGALYWGDSR